MNFILNLFLSNFFLQGLFFIISLYGGRRYTLPPFLSYSQFFTYSPLPVPFQEELVGIGYTSYFTFTGNNSSPFFLISPTLYQFYPSWKYLHIFTNICEFRSYFIKFCLYFKKFSDFLFTIFIDFIFYFQLINMSYNP